MEKLSVDEDNSWTHQQAVTPTHSDNLFWLHHWSHCAIAHHSKQRSDAANAELIDRSAGQLLHTLRQK